jgi:hypothetical protein
MLARSEIFQRVGMTPGSVANISVKLTSPPSTATYKYYSIALLNGSNTRESVLSEGVYTGASLLNFSLSTGNSRRKVRVSFYDASNIERLRWDSPGFSVGEVFMISKGRQPTQAELSTFMPKATSSTSPTNAWLANDVWVNAAD